MCGHLRIIIPLAYEVRNDGLKIKVPTAAGKHLFWFKTSLFFSLERVADKVLVTLGYLTGSLEGGYLLGATLVN